MGIMPCCCWCCEAKCCCGVAMPAGWWWWCGIPPGVPGCWNIIPLGGGIITGGGGGGGGRKPADIMPPVDAAPGIGGGMPGIMPAISGNLGGGGIIIIMPFFPVDCAGGRCGAGGGTAWAPLAGDPFVPAPGGGVLVPAWRVGGGCLAGRCAGAAAPAAGVVVTVVGGGGGGAPVADGVKDLAFAFSRVSADTGGFAWDDCCRCWCGGFPASAARSDMERLLPLHPASVASAFCIACTRVFSVPRRCCVVSCV